MFIWYQVRILNNESMDKKPSDTKGFLVYYSMLYQRHMQKTY